MYIDRRPSKAPCTLDMHAPMCVILHITTMYHIMTGIGPWV